jgi:hypothetical protein
MSTADPTITQLQTQQALFTQALKAMVQGSWAGGPETVEAFLYALDPNMTGTLKRRWRRSNMRGRAQCVRSPG